MPIRSNRNLTEYYDRFSASGAGGPQEFPEPDPNYGPRGIFASGTRDASPGESNDIDYVNISTTGNFTDFGDLQGNGRRATGCCSNSTRMCIGGGYDQNIYEGDYYQNIIGYITTSTTGNATNFGDLTVKRYALSALSNGARGCWANGQGNSPDAYKNTIDYITIASTGNATDFGDTTYAGRAIFCAANGTRGIIGGGNVSTNRIEYITIATTGNALDFGDLSLMMTGYNAASTGIDMARAVVTGGRAPSAIDAMQYVTIDTTGNTSDFGEMYLARDGHGACTNDTRMLSGGGNQPSSNSPDVEYITVANTGNGTDFGDLTVGRWYTAASSGSA